MPVKRALCLEEKENITPSKRLAADSMYSPLTGTCAISLTRPPHAAVSKAQEKADSDEILEPQTDKENLHALRSKIEVSVKPFMKARQQIEKMLSTGGSSELSRFFKGRSSDLQVELRKHRELCAMMEAGLDGIDSNRNCGEGPERPRSSYEFLKSILN